MHDRVAIRVHDIAKVLGQPGQPRDRRTVLRWLASYSIPVIKVGRTQLVWLADLQRVFPEMLDTGYRIAS
jgi:hypothetical protein